MNPFRRLALLLATVFSTGTAAEPARHVGPSTIAVPADRFAHTYHVSRTTGDDAKGDGSAAKPWASIRNALIRARDAAADKRYAVLIAAGSYDESPLQLRPHVEVFGGFDPTTWTRDVHQNVTTLDANLAGRVAVGADHARLDGFTLRNGRVRGPGGAILCDRTSPTITNNTILGNETLEPAGYVHELLHQRGHDGGAIACTNGAAPLIANNVIAGNATGVGGGAGIASSNYAVPTVLDNVIAENVTGRTDRNQSRSSNGAAISCSNLPSKNENNLVIRARIAGNLILNNRAGGRSDAGGVYCEYDAHPEVARNLILGNAAEDDGGGIYVMKSSEPLIVANVIAGNRGGGALRLSKEGRARIENNLIFANAGGGVNCVGSWMELVHNTVVGNGGGGLSFENHSRHLRPSIVVGNIFHANEKQQVRQSPAESITASHNLVTGGLPGDANFDADPMFADDRLSATADRASYDPHRARTTLELAAAPGDGPALVGRPIRAGERWGVVAVVIGREVTVWGDLTAGNAARPLALELPPTYRLRPGSPCIDKGATQGAPIQDIDGNPRANRADVGADELTKP